MTAKFLMPNQCRPLHFLYGRDDCCLCSANLKIEALEKEIEKLKHPTVQKMTVVTGSD